MAENALKRLVRRIEEQGWLDRPGHVIEHGYAFA